jgi:hypothetical protein
MPLKHSTFRWFEALSCKTTSVGHPSTNRFHHLNYSMQRTKNCRFFASRHTMSSSGLKTTNFSVKHLPLLIFISFHFSTKPAIAYTHCCAFVVFSVLSVSQRWLGSSFAFFCFALCVGKMQMCYQMRWVILS